MKGASRTRPARAARVAVTDLESLRSEVIAGLMDSTPHLPCKLFYDQRGAELFDAITRTEAYYPTRVETGILERAKLEIGERLGPHAYVVELGSGSGRKTTILLDALEQPAGYTPIDVSQEQLFRFAARLRRSRPQLQVRPLCADYTQPFELPPRPPRAERTLCFFPGSTIGNFEPLDALRFLRSLRALCGRNGALLIGVDLKKDRATLEHAYNDPEGITAAFNLNILAHINRKLSADFELSAFRHHAMYNDCAGRIEMRLMVTRDQLVTIPRTTRPDARIRLLAGQSIVTEHSYKYDTQEFECLAMTAGFQREQLWTDSERQFAVFLFKDKD
ncbi:MAG: L-histidine N(alpha)-methyltransferase [Gemmatimonadota bacterium]